MPKFRFLPEITAAGVAFEAFGKTERQLLENSGLALEDAMVEIASVHSRVKETVNIRELSLSDLLFSFLKHLIFLKRAKSLVFRKINLGVSREKKAWVLQGFAYGERINTNHKLKVDIKAPSKDLYDIEKLRNGVLRAQVILEI